MINNEESNKNQYSSGYSSNYKENIVDLIKAYYYDFNNNTRNFDAGKFFADKIELYITMRNTTPDAISKYMQTDFIKEFLNPNFGFEPESFSVTQQGDKYVAEYIESSKCFRNSKQKSQKVRVHVKAIIDHILRLPISMNIR